MTDHVELRLALQAERHADLDARLERLLAPLRGDERALDVGCGTGALAYALAPHVGEVVGVDSSEAYVDAARHDAPGNCSSRSATRQRSRSRTASSTSSAACASCTTSVGPSSSCPSSPGSRDRAGGSSSPTSSATSIRCGASSSTASSARVIPRTRACCPTPTSAASSTRTTSSSARTRSSRERRDMSRYLDLVGLEGEERERVARLAPAVSEVEVGWYVARKP